DAETRLHHRRRADPGQGAVVEGRRHRPDRGLPGLRLSAEGRAGAAEGGERRRGDRVGAGVYFFVYILASRRNGTLYVGMTDNLGRRMWEHKNGAFPGFTVKYDVKLLVWYEAHQSRESAFLRERQMKKWRRSWKVRLIEE